VLRLPIAHGEGNYTAGSAEALQTLEASRNVVLRYVGANPNGSANAIAGVINGSVFGLMPHPERASDDLLGSADGRLIFESIRATLSDWKETRVAA
jgi:phosphoribosylformylglycinamidine synthase